MKRAIHLLVVFTFALALIAPGCYTVISHPTDERGYAASQTSDCTRCHGDYNEFPYGYYYSPYPDYYWANDNYALYYAYPWWWDYYHGDIDDEDGLRDSKFSDRDAHPSPPLPPHVIIIDPIFMPGDVGNYYIPPSGDGGTSSRPGTETGSRGKTENNDDSGKETRQSNQNKKSAPKSEDSSNSDDSKKDSKPSKSKDTKKSRREGKP
ncbi:MAG: hypothetical protein KAR42_02100 [candidate division Zixibacteria bacterium]|nr:hypothetical protein [candidate division Zixibacteria bacterium]